jgi:hypothetical protein
VLSSWCGSCGGQACDLLKSVAELLYYCSDVKAAEFELWCTHKVWCLDAVVVLKS